MTHKPEPMTEQELRKIFNQWNTGPESLDSLMRMIEDARDAQWEEATKQLREDAERYRWLRSGNYDFNFCKSVLNDTPFGIDAAIDAAMKETT